MTDPPWQRNRKRIIRDGKPKMYKTQEESKKCNVVIQIYFRLDAQNNIILII